MLKFLILRKRIIVICQQECKLVIAMMETLSVLQKIKIELPYDPESHLCRYTCKRKWNQNLRHLVSHCLLSIIHNSQYMERPECPCMDECINKMCRVCIYTQTTEPYFAMRKKEILPLMTIQMNWEDIILSKNKPDRERQILYDLTYI